MTSLSFFGSRPSLPGLPLPQHGWLESFHASPRASNPRRGGTKPRRRLGGWAAGLFELFDSDGSSQDSRKIHLPLQPSWCWSLRSSPCFCRITHHRGNRNAWRSFHLQPAVLFAVRRLCLLKWLKGLYFLWWRFHSSPLPRIQ